MTMRFSTTWPRCSGWGGAAPPGARERFAGDRRPPAPPASAQGERCRRGRGCGVDRDAGRWSPPRDDSDPLPPAESLSHNPPSHHEPNAETDKSRSFRRPPPRHQRTSTTAPPVIEPAPVTPRPAALHRYRSRLDGRSSRPAPFSAPPSAPRSGRARRRSRGGDTPRAGGWRSIWRRAPGGSLLRPLSTVDRPRRRLVRHRDDRVGRHPFGLGTPTAPPTTPSPTPGDAARFPSAARGRHQRREHGVDRRRSRHQRRVPHRRRTDQRRQPGKPRPPRHTTRQRTNGARSLICPVEAAQRRRFGPERRSSLTGGLDRIPTWPGVRPEYRRMEHRR